VIKEVLEYVVNQGTKGRPAILKAEDGSGRLFKYDDAAQIYVELERYVNRSRSVSNIESFAQMVLEEARRAGADETSGHIDRGAGDRMTVIFGKDGAVFHLDDRDGRTAFHYQREISWQWQALQEAAKPREHLDFIRLLQKLRPSIVEYRRVLLEFRKVSFSQSVRVDSAPTLENGKAGLVHELEVHAKGNSGPTKVNLPSSIHLVLPFAQGSEKQFKTEAEVAIELAGGNGDQKRIVFSLTFADSFSLKEEAIAHEVAWFREKTASLTRLSILEDY